VFCCLFHVCWLFLDDMPAFYWKIEGTCSVLFEIHIFFFLRSKTKVVERENGYQIERDNDNYSSNNN
jgi:hypothetical protein